MTMYQFMVNAFYMLCGVACVAASRCDRLHRFERAFQSASEGAAGTMADIKIDEEMLLRAGLGIGYAFAPFFQGIMNGVEDYTIEQAAREMQEEHDAQEVEEGLKRPVEKTLIGDCRKCWCDQCAKLEQCVHLREGALPDRGTPVPLRRVRGRNALQALRRRTVRRLRAGRRI
ncbi:MAG: hypothetical protein ACLR1P_07560 [Oscillospiraceae bacterium]